MYICVNKGSQFCVPVVHRSGLGQVYIGVLNTGIAGVYQVSEEACIAMLLGGRGLVAVVYNLDRASSAYQ